MDQPVIASVDVPRTFVHTALLCCGITGSILFTFTYFSFGAMAPDYEIMRQPIGDLALLPHGWIQSANFIVFGLFIGAFSLGLRKELPGGYIAALILLSYDVTTLALILLGLFISGPIHSFAGVVAFTSMVISFLLFARTFTGDHRWKGWATGCVLMAIWMVLLLAVLIYAKNNNGPYAGVFERLALFTRMIWLLIFTLKLLDGRRLTPLK